LLPYYSIIYKFIKNTIDNFYEGINIFRPRIPRSSHTRRRHSWDRLSMPNPEYPSRNPDTWTCKPDRMRHNPPL